MKYFKSSLIITFFGLLAAFLWGGLSALFLTLMLSILEISISFDNAIVQVGRLKSLNTVWQKRFLTWGIFIAVFVVRMLLPLCIVAFLTHLNIIDILCLAFKDPIRYSHHLTQAKPAISSFGGIFLGLVFLSFLFDKNKSIHWLGHLERKLALLGKYRFIPIFIAIATLIGLQALVPLDQQFEVMVAGALGIIVFIVLHLLTAALNKKNQSAKHSYLMQFLYLEVLDASFSLDSVIGAFAISKDIVIILLGLTIGAVFVRSITIFLVHHQTTHKYPFLEHGAFYAVGALGIIMLIDIIHHVPEILTGLIGVGLLGLSLLSSIFYNKNRL